MMVSLRKIIGDLRQGWGRVLLLLLAVMIGQAAMTASFSALTIVSGEIGRNFSMASPPEAVVEVSGFDPSGFDQVPAVPGVLRMDVASTYGARYRVANGTWRQIMLFGRRDFNDMRSLRVFSKTGDFPPGLNDVLIERSGLSLIEAQQGGEMEIGYGQGQTTTLRFAGVVHDPTQAPSYQENMIYGYVNMATLRAIAGPRSVQFLIMLEPGASPLAVTQALSQLLTDRGAHVLRVNLTPARHPHADLMNGLLLLLAASSVLSFIIALFLSGSIVASLTQRQARQMAVLRAMGASRLRIAFLHLGFVLTPALVGLVLGAMLGALGARLLETGIAWQLNLDIARFDVSPQVRNGLLIAGAACVFLAVLAPIASAVRRPVREVLQDTISSRGRPWLRFSILSPLDQMAVAEAFRRPFRTAVTVIALAVAGVGLIASANTYASLMGVVDRFLAHRTEDLTTVMTTTPNLEVLRANLDRITDLRRYEVWDVKTVTISRTGFPALRLPLSNRPDTTAMRAPAVVEGRLPERAGEIVISQLASRMMFLPLGANVTLAGDARSTSARVVGLVDEWGLGLSTNEATFSRLVETNDRARVVKAITAPGREVEASLAVERAVLAAGSFPLNTATRSGFRSTMVNHFLSFFQFLWLACITAAVVGAAALSSTVGSNVLERTREIGVLRTLGATSADTFRLVLVQALSLSLFSLVLALALSVPLSIMVVDMMEKGALRMSMPLHVSWVAVAGWSAGSLLIAALAALAPTLRIRGLPIREAIAHD